MSRKIKFAALTRVRLLSLNLLVAILLVYPSYAKADWFTPLGDFPGGNFDSRGGGVSNDGVVTGSGRTAEGVEAFRWTSGGGMIGLGELASDEGSGGSGISADGETVVGLSGNATGPEGFRWNSSDGMVGLGKTSTTSTYVWTFANAVSVDGSVIVGEGLIPFGEFEAAYWQETTGWVSIGDLPGGDADSEANAVAVVGSEILIVGEGEDAVQSKPFLWSSESGMQILPGFPALAGGEALDISSDGSTIVGKIGSNDAFVWTDSGVTQITPDLDGSLGFLSIGRAVAVSDFGQRVVGNGDHFGTIDTLEAYIYDKDAGLVRMRQVLTDLGVDLTGWSEIRAFDISPNGRYVTGYGKHNGNNEAYLVELPASLVTIPEPSSLALAGIGLVGFLFLARFRRSSHGAKAS